MKIPSPRVFISGGLGNQLFQYAFAHFLAKVTSLSPTLINLNTKGGLPHTKEVIDINQFECQHCLQVRNWGSNNFNALINPWISKSPFKSVWGKSLYLQNKPFEFISHYDILSQFSNFIGYFQNKKYILESKDYLYLEIRKLVSQSIPHIIPIQQGIEVVHIRQGDTKTPENMKGVGVLASEYYEQILEYKSNLLRIVVTDDLSGARQTLRNLSVDLWFGPKDLTAIQTLRLMSRANRLVTANSTLSWWAGFLTIQDGNTVEIPEPFFKSSDLFAGNAFHFPGFKLRHSIFI